MPPDSPSIDACRSGPLGAFLNDVSGIEVAEATANFGLPLAGGDPDHHALIFAGHRLQDIRDYRAALQAWFGALRIGGHLVLVVPHAHLFDRNHALPSILRPAQRRLYTPASLLDEMEEALVPNSYRVRWLGDLDDGYDYRIGRDEPAVGNSDIAVVIERITPPAWTLGDRPAPVADAPPYAFETPHTRVETAQTWPIRSILVLKLDHLGDFVMGLPALEKLRRAFPDADITLVVGSWNADIARDLELADRIISFDVFPRNAAEDRVDVRGKTALFEAAVTGRYDLAIDLRTDTDTRFLLAHVQTDLRAGLGTRAQFPFLDIFLPIDFNRQGPESVAIDDIPARDHRSGGACLRTPYQIACTGAAVERNGVAILWGPYRDLGAGRYIFEPFIDLAPDASGLLAFDIALGAQAVMRGIFTGGHPQIGFDVGPDGAQMEFRLWPVGDEPVPDFRFFGGRLIRQGADSVLHQSEYLLLLIELIVTRTAVHGVLRDRAQ